METTLGLTTATVIATGTTAMQTRTRARSGGAEVDDEGEATMEAATTLVAASASGRARCHRVPVAADETPTGTRTPITVAAQDRVHLVGHRVPSAQTVVRSGSTPGGRSRWPPRTARR